MSALPVNGRSPRSRIGAVVLSSALVTLFLVAVAETASAVSTCTYLGGTVTVTIGSGESVSLAIGTLVAGNVDVYVMNADGSGQTRLTTDPAPDLSPDWQPVP